MKVHPTDLAAIRAEKIDVEGAIVREQGCKSVNIRPSDAPWNAVIPSSPALPIAEPCVRVFVMISITGTVDIGDIREKAEDRFVRTLCDRINSPKRLHERRPESRIPALWI
jgi:hypothetical protein